MKDDSSRVFSALFNLLIFLYSFADLSAQAISRDSINSMYARAGEHSDKGNFEEAKNLIHQALEYSKASGDSNLYGQGAIEIAEIHFFKKNLSQAVEYAALAESYCAGKCDSTVLLKIAGVFGGIHQVKGNFQKALMHYEEALELCKRPGLEEYYMDIRFNMTSTLGDMGMYDEMLSALVECKDYYKDKDRPDKLATIYNNLGLAYDEHFREPENALENYRKAIAIDKKIGNQWGLSRDYNNIALTFERQEEYDSTMHYLTEGIGIRKDLNDEGGLAFLYNAMGNLLLKTGKFEEAQDYFLQSKEIADKYGIAEGQYYTNLGLGLASDSIGLSTKALGFYQNALAYAQQTGSIQQLKSAYEHLFRHYKARGNYREALEAYEEVQLYADSLDAMRYDDKLLALKVDYEGELHEKENDLLKAQQERQLAVMEQNNIKGWAYIISAVIFLLIALALFFAYRTRNKAYNIVSRQKKKLEQMNTRLEEKGKQLNASNSSKDRLFSVISHDLRGPLASLESCLEILISEDLDDAERNDLIKDLRNETRNTLKTLDDMLAWSKTQMTGIVLSKEDIHLESLIQEIRDLYLPVARHKNVEIHIDNNFPQAYINADAYQIRTVLRNLLSNAIKFTPQHSQANIIVTKEDSDYRLTVSDQGKGISESDMEKIKDPNDYFTSRGTDNEKGTGVGLILSLEFLRAHNSELIFEKNEPTGTLASFRLKAAGKA